MLKNYFKIALRKIARQKMNTFITVGGLAIGIASAVFIFSFILNELSYDRFNKNQENIFRVVTGNIGEPDAWAGTPAPLGPTLRNSLPEVKEFVRMNLIESFVRADNKSFHEKKVLCADPSLFKVFSFQVIEGNVNNLLSDPNSVVISESTAIKYFGDKNPLGQILMLDEGNKYHVTGVFADVPKNSHLQFDMVLQFEKVFKSSLQSWGMYNYSTYLLTNSNIDEQVLLDKIRNVTVEFRGQKNKLEGFNLQRLTEIHFQYIRGNYEPVYETQYIYILGSIAFFLLLLVCINYINMMTALAPTRAKEVGIKKVVGSDRYRLVSQLLAESFLHIFIAVAVAISLLEATTPLMNSILGEKVTINLLSAPVLLAFLGIILIVGILSAIYPALLISNYKPALILKGVLPGKKKSILRNVLVVLQFSIAIFFIISTLTSLRQLDLLKNKNLGMNKELIVNVSLPSKSLQNKSQELKNEFLKYSNILKASVNTFQMGDVNWHQSVYWEGQTDKEKTAMYIIAVDKDFFETYNIPFIQGEETTYNFASDSIFGFVLNQSALKEIGWQHAVGKNFGFFSDISKETALGVVNDFNFRSLHHEIEPCVMFIYNMGNQISVKISSHDIPATLKYLETTFERFAPGVPFEYNFVDNAYYQLYNTERISSNAVLFFAILSIFIASMGLFGLVSFMVVQRTKEIGIRKVLGASVSQTMSLLLKEFVALVVLANIIIWPLAYYFMNKWLQDFAYRINMSWWVFALSGGIALLIALATVGFRAIKAATANPVKSLRYE